MLVVSTAPALLAKWLGRASTGFQAPTPDRRADFLDAASRRRFGSDGVDVAIRNLTRDAPADPSLFVERLFDQAFLPVLRPRVAAQFRPFAAPADLGARRSFTTTPMPAARECRPGPTGFAAGEAGADVNRGLRFNSADHGALEAAVVEARALLSHSVLAYDDLHRPAVIAFDRPLPLAARLLLRLSGAAATRPRCRPSGDGCAPRSTRWTGIAGRAAARNF